MVFLSPNLSYVVVARTRSTGMKPAGRTPDVIHPVDRMNDCLHC